MQVFGREILRDDEEVDRAKLGEIIFNDPTKRSMLNRYLTDSIFWIEIYYEYDRQDDRFAFVCQDLDVGRLYVKFVDSNS